MSEYYWDKKVEYLRNTRWLYYNDDYLEFLVREVWKIKGPVNIIDFGCGYGYLGLKLLPLLPEGSTYTGIDKGTELISKAKEIFQELPYTAEFIIGDIEEITVDQKYDIAMSHALLLHMSDSKQILKKMIDSVINKGRLICFESHWIASMSNYSLDGVDLSEIVQLGILQKLFEADSKGNGKDGNIGMQLPIIFSQLGLIDVECRVSDRVNFLDQNMDEEKKKILFHSLKEEGLGLEPGDRDKIIENLINRGLTEEEAQKQYEVEFSLSQKFGVESWFTYSPNMKVTFGTIKR